jgi:hypothetical protein
MFSSKSIDFLWLVLMGLTLVSVVVAESERPGLWATLFIAVVIGLKGRIVVERFMELHNANRRIRALMNTYFYIFPVLIVLVELFPDLLAAWTRLPN